MILTPCPGIAGDETPCTGRVRVLNEKETLYCCVPCWETSWTIIQMAMGVEGVEVTDHGHSEQCHQRQAVRRDQHQDLPALP